MVAAGHPKAAPTVAAVDSVLLAPALSALAGPPSAHTSLAESSITILAGIAGDFSNMAAAAADALTPRKPVARWTQAVSV